MYYYIQSFICAHILQGSLPWTGGNGHSGPMVCLGAGHPPCKHISSGVINL